MMMGTFMLMPMLLLGGGLGGANELLDYLQTETYWKTRNIAPDVQTLMALVEIDPKAEDISALIKQLGHEEFDKREAASAAIGKKGPSVIPQLKVATKSSDAEVADRATRLITELSGGDADPAIHKLMVIRTLGELKDKTALPVLTPLIKSKDPFVAAYAARAIAAIEGKPHKPEQTTAETFDKDVWMLPNGVKLVAQLTMPPNGPIDWTKVLANMQAPFAVNVPKDQVLAKSQKAVLTALNHTGNIRIDGITFGLSGDPDDNSGFAVVYARGLYDRDKIKTAFARQNVDVKDEDGVFSATLPQGAGHMLMPSNDLFVMVVGPPGQDLPVARILTAIKTGKGSLAEDVPMAELIKSANRKGGGWGVAQMTPTYRSGSPWLEPFDTIVAERIMQEGKVSINLTGAGKSAEAVQTAVSRLNTDLDEAREQMKQAAGFVPQPIIDFVNTLKVKSDGKQATLTGTMEGGFESILGTMLVPMIMMQEGGF